MPEVPLLRTPPPLYPLSCCEQRTGLRGRKRYVVSWAKNSSGCVQCSGSTVALHAIRCRGLLVRSRRSRLRRRRRRRRPHHRRVRCGLPAAVLGPLALGLKERESQLSQYEKCCKRPGPPASVQGGFEALPASASGMQTVSDTLRLPFGSRWILSHCG